MSPGIYHTVAFRVVSRVGWRGREGHPPLPQRQVSESLKREEGECGLRPYLSDFSPQRSVPPLKNHCKGELQKILE